MNTLLNNSDQKYTGVDNLEVMSLAKNYNQFLFDLVEANIKDKSEVLDFGAGIGTFLKYFKSKNRCHLVGVEVDLTLSSQLRNEGFSIFNSIDEIKDNSIDNFYTLNVLEHIEKDDLAVKSLFRVLKNKGQGLIYLPAFNILYSSMDKKVGHYRRYRKKDLIPLLKNAGFKIKKIKYADSLGFFVALLFKFIGNDSGEINPKSLIIYDKFLFPISKFLDHILGTFFGKNILAIVEKGNSSPLKMRGKI